MDELGEVRTTINDHILLIEVDRSAKRNAFTPKMMHDMAVALTQLDDDPQLWVGVICFAGEHMTAGLDLPLFSEAFAAGKVSADDDLVDPFGLKRRPQKPVVMAVQGSIFTVGIELMLAADIVIAADSVKLCQLEPKRGLAVFGGAAHRYVERAGWGNAMYHLLRADVFDADTALRLGFVQEVVPHGTQRERAMEVAGEIAQCAPKALQWIKRNALAYEQQGEAAAIAMIPEMMRDTARSADAAEGLASFIERRAPVFTGQ
jgi:enoyl-CoA hydratase